MAKSKRSPKITVFKDKKGEWRFNFKAANGKIIAVSEGYKTYAGCENGINAVLEMAKTLLEGGHIQIEKIEE